MASLAGTQLKDTYESLLKLSDNDALTATYKEVTDGEGAGTNLYVGTDGNVGIGGSPSVPLEIIGSASTMLSLNRNSGGSDVSLKFKTNTASPDGTFLNGGGSLALFRFFTESTERLRIKSTGDISFRDTSNNEAFYWDASTARLGIGNQAPTVALDVTGDIALSNDLYVSNGNFIKLQRNSGGLYLDVLGTPSGTDDVRLLTSGAFDIVNGSLTSMLKVDSSGNVGIGETDPDSKLHLKSASAELLELERTSVGAYRLAISASDAFSIYDVAEDSDRLIIDSSGNTSIYSGVLNLGSDSVASSLNCIGDVFNIGVDSDGNSGGSPNMRFNVSGSEKMRIDSSGNVTITTGNLILDSGAGIDFSDTPNTTASGATMTSELLDDYEEGTWTPTFVASTVDFTSVTYDTGFTGGKYTKIGDLVHIQGVLRTDAITVGSASGVIHIGGIPFAIGGSTNGRDGFITINVGVAINFAGSHPVTMYGGAGTSKIIPMKRNYVNGNTENLAIADLDTGTDKNLIYFSGTYKS